MTALSCCHSLCVKWSNRKRTCYVSRNGFITVNQVQLLCSLFCDRVWPTCRTVGSWIRNSVGPFLFCHFCSSHKHFISPRCNFLIIWFVCQIPNPFDETQARSCFWNWKLLSLKSCFSAYIVCYSYAGSFSFSVLSGKVMFRDVYYINQDMSIR